MCVPSFGQNKTENFLVYEFWIHFDWILTDILLAFDWIVAEFGWIFVAFWLHFDSILPKFGCIFFWIWNFRRFFLQI